ncbi:MAG: FtsX-like permease family protein [Ekhidna sp.]
MNNTPLKYPLRLLRLFCKEEYLEEIEGDLLEQFERRISKNRPAHLLLWVDVLKLIRPRILKHSNTQSRKTTNMLSHNLKVSLRSFKRHKTSFLINYIGLVGGLVTVLFIYLWVNHELSVDRFHENDGQIYRLVSDNGGSKTLLNTNPYFASELEEAIPEIDYAVHSAFGPLVSNLSIEEKAFSTRGEFGTKKFFDLFSYPLTSGEASTVLNAPNAIVLSESMAIKLFGSRDVIGNPLVWRWYSMEEPLVVTGIFRDLPKNSSEQFDYVLSFDVFEKRMGDRLRRTRSARTFLKLTDGASPQIVNQKIHDYTRATYPDFEGDPAFIIDFAGYYLESQYENGQPVGGRIELVRLFIVIGLLVLIIACINFMNLSTARAALRTKEIGVRKTMGALRKSLISQYLTESCLISLAAGVSAMILAFLLLPFFENLLDQRIEIPFNYPTTIGFLGIILFTGLLSGSYPALYLSGFSPLKVLKGPFLASSKDQLFRKGLVVFQFGISLILLVSVLVIYQQMHFIQTKSLGYENDYIINFGTTGMNGSKQQAFLSEVRQISGVEKADGVSHALFGAQRSGSNMTWQGKDPEEEVWFEYGHVGHDMLELLEVRLHEGRFFSKEFGDETSKVVINRATKELMGVQNAVEKKFTVGETAYEIIGVTEDFHFQSLHEQIKPTFFLLNTNDWYMKLAIKINPNQLQETLSEIDNLYATLNPGFAFEYSFHDQDQAAMYESETKISSLTKYAAGLAILISSLGLFGLVSFVVERKSKEMGIRKVLGASSGAIAGAVSKDFIFPIAVASVLGIVASTLLINNWLDQFAYRIYLKWWFFVAAIGLMTVIALMTTISQVLKAIMTNPISALRDE